MTCKCGQSNRTISFKGIGKVSEKIKHVTDGSFDQDVLNADGPVLVDYWAEWCGPCKMIAPVLDEIAGKYDGKLKIANQSTYAMSLFFGLIPKELESKAAADG